LLLLSSMASLVSCPGLDAVVALIHSLVTVNIAGSLSLHPATAIERRNGRRNGSRTDGQTALNWSGAEWRAVGDPLPPPSLPAVLAPAGLIRRLMMMKSGGGGGVAVVVPPLGVLQLQGRRVKRDPTTRKRIRSDPIRSAFFLSCSI
jgi:hypothetical protein